MLTVTFVYTLYKVYISLQLFVLILRKIFEVTWRTERAPRPSTSRTQRARGTRSSRTEPIRIHR